MAAQYPDLDADVETFSAMKRRSEQLETLAVSIRSQVSQCQRALAQIEEGIERDERLTSGIPGLESIQLFLPGWKAKLEDALRRADQIGFYAREFHRLSDVAQDRLYVDPPGPALQEPVLAYSNLSAAFGLEWAEHSRAAAEVIGLSRSLAEKVRLIRASEDEATALLLAGLTAFCAALALLAAALGYVA